ncbi:cytochrome P450 2K1-like [Salmo trutta]|uniref:cytochrome P450 2K1-like n=1 Tax=Salmo trutta TaxID=8032 RepID=UPI001132240A|nr:cytochrome P450 2K1-like [Salmo trutta]
MALMGGLLLQAPSTVTLLGAVLFLLVFYLFFSGSNSEEQGKEPPGPRPLPLLGNMLQLDLKRPYCTLCELSKKYGSIFTIHFGPKKVVVLAGYKTVKQALINQAEEFGDRDITPVFYEFNHGHGILFAKGNSWKEKRLFALTNLRDFGMGKKLSKEKILKEIHYLIEVYEKPEGKAFDTTQPVIYAVANLISAIVYGSRFEYTDQNLHLMHIK